MDTNIMMRLFGHTIAIAIQVYNIVSMTLAAQDTKTMNYPELQVTSALLARYIVIWNTVLHWFYFSIAFVSDIMTYLGEERLIPKKIMAMRHIMLSAFLWPISAVTLTLFWPVYVRNTELLFPSTIDKIFSFNNIMAIHFALFPGILLEILLLPRPVPRSHIKYVFALTNVFTAYLALFMKSYYKYRRCPYPIVEEMYDTIYFPIFFFSIYVMCLLYYFVQWKISPIIVVKKRRKIKLK